MRARAGGGARRAPRQCRARRQPGRTPPTEPVVSCQPPAASTACRLSASTNPPPRCLRDPELHIHSRQWSEDTKE
ncbi:unnamed protein product [Arctia plantaginis]|uniref:Uncharacterized protein n=1 Tax=Arctia plantaginis TaxID=874455 RepID=A0A8S1AYL6_ARCPL|nr:unnamed protein product [Arctia plantaginis]CAB3250444.1 unnamed protein product [Arctia plantaginis]